VSAAIQPRRDATALLFAEAAEGGTYEVLLSRERLAELKARARSNKSRRAWSGPVGVVFRPGADLAGELSRFAACSRPPEFSI